jgi:4-diphosphocytidyl-2C-methyl-D-erythritol kinase
VFAQHPLLAEVLAQLATPDALVARMSGSGSTLLRIGPRPHPALSLPPGWRCVETETAG